MQVEITRKKAEPLQHLHQKSAPGPNEEQQAMGQWMQAAVQNEESRPLNLPDAMRQKMENRFGQDFSGVRVVQSDLPRKIGADAVAQGNLIRFAPGAFSRSESGERLLSHELSHVMQQSQGKAMDSTPGMPYYDAGAEQAADRMAQQAMDGGLSQGAGGQPLSVPAASQAPMLGNRLFNRLRQKFSGWFGRGNTPVGASPTEVTQAQLGANMYNPTGDDALEAKLESIRGANTLDEAQAAFGRATGNTIGGRINADVSLSSAKRRLKAMTRMTHDFPELQGKISSFGDEGDSGAMMSASNTFNGGAQISWSPTELSSGAGSKLKRIVMGWGDSAIDFSAANKRYDGVHELGHVVNSLLIEQNYRGRGARDADWNGNITAQALIQEALQGVAGQDTKQGRKLKKYIEEHGVADATGKKKLDLQNDTYIRDRHGDEITDKSTNQYRHRHKLKKMGLTSEYGASDAGEMFAEAFADVYEKGEKANPLSKEIVRLAKGRLSPPASGGRP